MNDGRDVLSRSAAGPDLTLRYGDLPDQVADVRLPTTAEARPLVIVVHGGFWMAEFDRTHAGPQSAALAAAGYVVATVDYRRLGQTGGGWPGTFDDVAALTDAVPALVADALPDRVDTTRAVLVGHSAGGHLAAWAAARHRLPPESPWHRTTPIDARVVSLAGVLDLDLSERLGLGAHAAKHLLGGSPRRRPDRYAVASPAALVPTGGRLIAVHGLRDKVVPVEMSRRYVDLARAAGDAVDLLEIPDCGHFELIDPLSRAWPTVLTAVAMIMKDPRGSSPLDPS
jgi:acetyl esterase/lipase